MAPFPAKGIRNTETTIRQMCYPVILTFRIFVILGLDSSIRSDYLQGVVTGPEKNRANARLLPLASALTATTTSGVIVMAKPNVSARAAQRNEARKNAHPANAKFTELLIRLHLALAMEQHLLTCTGSSRRTDRVILTAENCWNELELAGRQVLAETAAFAAHWQLREGCRLIVAGKLLRDHPRSQVLFTKIVQRLNMLQFSASRHPGGRPLLMTAARLMAKASVLEGLSACDAEPARPSDGMPPDAPSEAT